MCEGPQAIEVDRVSDDYVPAEQLCFLKNVQAYYNIIMPILKTHHKGTDTKNHLEGSVRAT